MGSAQEDKNNVKGWRLGAYQPNRTQDIKSNQLKALIKMSPGNSFSLKKNKKKKSVIAQEKLQDYFKAISSDMLCVCGVYVFPEERTCFVV